MVRVMCTHHALLAGLGAAGDSVSKALDTILKAAAAEGGAADEEEAAAAPPPKKKAKTATKMARKTC